MAVLQERENGSLPVIPDPYEEGLTPKIPGQGIAEFQPDPADRVDISRLADNYINRPSHTVSPNGHRPKILATSRVL